MTRESIKRYSPIASYVVAQQATPYMSTYFPTQNINKIKIIYLLTFVLWQKLISLKTGRACTMCQDLACKKGQKLPLDFYTCDLRPYLSTISTYNSHFNSHLNSHFLLSRSGNSFLENSHFSLIARGN